ASFRNVGQIRALAGCDLLTISPELLDELSNCTDPLERRLEPESAKRNPPAREASDEVAFRSGLNDDAMATEKLAEGLRNFCADWVNLDALLAWAAGRPKAAHPARDCGVGRGNCHQAGR